MSSLTSRKLKIWSSGPRSQVMVFQDGTTPDSDATSGFRFDDAFRSGVLEQGQTAAINKVWITAAELQSDYDTGPTLVFDVQSPSAPILNAYPNLAFKPNDRVELWCDAPASNAAVATPSWHLNNQTGQVRVFYGWVETFEATPGGGIIRVTCRSALWKANDVRIVRSGAEGITLPKIAFNVDPDSPEFFYAIKRTATVPAVVWTVGSPADMGDYRMTGQEILQYLEQTYATSLVAQAVIPTSQIFVPSEIATLTTKPPPIILENVGFTEAVRQVLQAFPDVALQVDPRTRLWHITRVEAGMQSVSTTLNGGTTNIGSPSHGRIPVADHTLFNATPGAAGYQCVIHSANDPEKTQRLTVLSAAAGIVEVNEYLDGTYSSGDKLIPMQAEILPTVGFRFDTQVEAKSLKLSSDLRDVYTAVNITSVHQKTSKEHARWAPGLGAPTLQKGWKTAYEQFWKEADADRESDMGKDGSGMKIRSTDTGGTGGNIRLFIPATESGYLSDHQNDEWKNTTAWFQTAGGADARNNRYAYRIVKQDYIADIGGGLPGLRIEIAHTDPATVVGAATLKTIVIDGDAAADKVGLTQNFGFSSTYAPNARWEVGRKWIFTSMAVNSGTAAPHLGTCKVAQLTVYDGGGRPRQEMAVAAGGMTPPLNAQGVQHWEQVAGGGIGAHFVYRRAFMTQRPAVGLSGANPARCDRTGWQPPLAVDAEIEFETTEIRSARYPPLGHAGMAATYYSLQRVKELTANHWFMDSQNQFYEDLAFRIWNSLQHIHYTGGATIFGAKEHLAWLDLGIRAAFTTGMFPGGAPSILTQFWAKVAGVTYDLVNDRANLSFDSASAFRELALTVFEDYLVKDAARLHSAEDLIRKTAELPECLAGSRPTATSPYQCDENIRSGARNAGTRIKVIGKDNQGHGFSDSAAGNAQAGGAGGTTTHGVRATETVIRDLRGGSFLIATGEAILPGTVGPDGLLTVDPASQAQPFGAAQQAQAGATAALAAMWGLTPATTPLPIFTSTIATSQLPDGRVEFSVRHSGMTVDALAGGELHVLDYLSDTVRGPYRILSNTTGKITVADPGVPFVSVGIDVAVRAFYRPAPEPASGDFPAGSIVVTDANGAYAVLDPTTGKVTAGTYDATTNTVSRSATGTVVIRLGPAADTGTTIDWENDSRTIGAGFDGDTAEIVDNTVVEKLYPFPFRLDAVRLMADRPGGITVHIRARSFTGYDGAGFEPIHPIAPAIVEGDGTQVFEYDQLSGWTRDFESNTVLQFEATGVVDIRRLEASLEITRR